MEIKASNDVQLTRPLGALCDTGRTGTLFKDTYLLLGAKPVLTKEVAVLTTTHGTHKYNVVTYLEYIQLPEFVNGRLIEGLKGNIFHLPTCSYDVILGSDFLQAIGIRFDDEYDVIQWLDIIVDMK